ncbi:hypothetical protein HPB47_026068, partial [Ixodes persulcatus]
RAHIPSSAPKPPPLPPRPWERHVTLTADAPLPQRMDDDNPERTSGTLPPWTHEDMSFTTRTLLAAPFLPKEHHPRRR